MTFLPKFADLVRNSVTVDGTGVVTLGSAVPGFSGLAQALSTGDQFYYCLANDDRPNEREVGRGKLLAGGKVERGPISGTPVSFSSGAKSLSLVAAAEYYRGASTDMVRQGASPLPASPAALFAAAAPVVLAPARTVVPDLGAGINFNLTVTGDTLIADPIGAKAGQSGRLRIAQDSTGGRKIAFGDRWQFAGGPPVLADAPGAVELIAYLVNADNAVEASAVGTLDALPQPLSVSDFKHGFYSVGGVRKSFAEMWGGGGPFPFDPTTLVDGVGITLSGNADHDNQLRAAAAHMAALKAASNLTNGVTFVLDYSLTQGTPGTEGVTKPRVTVEMNSASGNEGWSFYQNGETHVVLADYWSFRDFTYPGPLGDSRMALTFASDGLVSSRNGAAAVLAVDDEGYDNPPLPDALQSLPDAANIDLAVYLSHTSSGPPSTATLRSLRIYAKQPPAMLPLLSRA